MYYERFANKSRLLRELYAMASFERFKTLLRVQIDVFLTRINVFLTQLTPFLRDPYVIRAQIARHVQPRTTDPNRVKLAQKPEFGRDQYVIRPLGLCDRAFRYIKASMWSGGLNSLNKALFGHLILYYYMWSEKVYRPTHNIQMLFYK